jgi:hypothetical protein
MHPVQTHVALGHDTAYLIHTGNIVRACGTHSCGIHVFGMAGKNNRARGFVAQDGPLVINHCLIHAGRFKAVTALFRKKQPVKFAVLYNLGEPYQPVRYEAQVSGILMRTPVHGFFGRQLMPLLAGYLTSAAGCAAGKINKERLSHFSASLQLADVDHERLGFGNAGIGVAH